MPVYDFYCEHCMEQMYTDHLIESGEVVHCPRCGKKLKQLFPLSTFKLKGDGWAKDGYSKKDKK